MRFRPVLYALLLLMVFLFNNSAATLAYTGEPEPYAEKLERGIEAFYQTEWDKASKIFQELKSENEKDPRAFFFDSMIPFWEYFFGGNSSSVADDFLERSQKAIEISNDQLSRNPHDTTMVLMLSGLHGYRSLVAASEKNYQTAIQSGMTGFTYTRQLLALDDSDPKALIGKGIFYYMVGTIPKELRWATNMMGIKGSRKEGFEILERAAKSESYVSNDAKMILSYLYRREDMFDQAMGHIKDLCEKYEGNIIFQFNYAELLEKDNRDTEAQKAYRTVSQSESSHLWKLREQSRNKLRKL